MLIAIYVMLGALALAIAPAIACNLNGSGSCLGVNGTALIFGPICLVCLVASVAVYRDEKAKKARDSETDSA